MEPITIHEDGSIDEVEMTSCGSGTYIHANTIIPTCYCCEMHGNVRIEGDTESNHTLPLRQIKPSDRAIFRCIGFNGENAVDIEIKSDGNMKIDIPVRI